MNLIESLKEFHDAYHVEGQTRFLNWNKLDDPKEAELAQFRFLLVKEEFTEFVQAIKDCELDITNNEKQAHVLKEICDVFYVLAGWCEKLGWDVDEAFRRVHASNMSKLGVDGKPILRDDGKVMKGPNYKEPDLIDLVARQDIDVVQIDGSTTAQEVIDGVSTEPVAD